MGVDLVCQSIREELSARLDGEAESAGQAAVDNHLNQCAACQVWWEQASAVTRLARVSAALPSPGLSPQALENVLAAAPQAAGTRKVKAAWILRLALLVVGVGQFLLGVTQISTRAGELADHTHAGEVSSGHLWHESAAWNVAIGAALAWLAWRRTRPAALLPVMTAFVSVLALLTANDAMAGRVDTSRILSHGLVLTGYLLLLVASMRRFGGLKPPAATGTPGRRWSMGNREDDGPIAPVYPFPVQLKAVQRVTAQTRRAA